jgi:hypothetical protein
MEEEICSKSNQFFERSISQKWGIWNLNKELSIRKKEQKW